MSRDEGLFGFYFSFIAILSFLLIFFIEWEYIVKKKHVSVDASVLQELCVYIMLCLLNL